MREQKENSIHGMYASRRRVCEYALYTYATTVHKIFICVYLVVLAILFHTSLAPGTKGWLPRSCIAVQQRVYTWRAHLSPFHPSIRRIWGSVSNFRSIRNIRVLFRAKCNNQTRPECPRCNYGNTL